MRVRSLLGVKRPIKSITLQIGVLIVASLIAMTTTAKEKTKVVDCGDGSGKTINQAIDKANDGDKIIVKGTCTENVVITKGVILDGEGTASIVPADIAAATISVSARKATISGFSLEAAKPGSQILVGDMSVLIVDNNQIGNAEGAAINILGASLVTIIGNHIYGSDTGIQATETATIRVGYNGFSLVPEEGNLIENNRIGIVLARAFGNIAGNTIINNIRFGVVTSRTASARVASNEISGNLIGLVNTANGTLDQVLEGSPVFGQSNTGVNLFEGFRCLSGYASTSSTSTFGPTNIFPNCLYEVEVPN